MDQLSPALYSVEITRFSSGSYDIFVDIEALYSVEITRFSSTLSVPTSTWDALYSVEITRFSSGGRSVCFKSMLCTLLKLQGSQATTSY